MLNTQVKNKKGQFVPAIPEPYEYIFGICKCMECKKIFIGIDMYNRHYAWKHILDY